MSIDQYGIAIVLEEFGHIIARGGSGVVIASQSGHRLGALANEQNKNWWYRIVYNTGALPVFSNPQTFRTI